MILKHKILLLISIFITITHTAVPDNYTQSSTKNLISNISNLGFSNDQRILIVLQDNSQGYFYVYDGLKINNQRKIFVKDSVKKTASPSAFVFTKNNDLLILGTKQGGIYGFQIVNDTVNQNYTYNYAVEPTTQDHWVKSISIDSNNNITIAAKDQLLVLRLPQKKEELPIQFDKIIQSAFSHIISSVCWSILQPQIIIVGAMGQNSGNFSLFYTQNKTTRQINSEKTQSLAISPDGKIIVKGTQNKIIGVYSYQVGDIPKFIQNFTDTNSSKNIQFSQNGLYLSAQIYGNKIKAWRVIFQSQTNLKMQTQNLKLSFILNLDQKGSKLAISPSGNDIITVQDSASANVQVLSLCQGDKYFNPQAKDCSGCSQNCLTCFTQKVCTSCTTNKFINGDQCFDCNTKLDGCLTCSNSQTCLTCDSNQRWNQQPQNGKCTCQDTFYNKNGKCSQCGVFLDCINCVGDDNCTLCKQENNFASKPVDGHCVCKDSFWLNLTDCIPCQKSITNCLFCSQDGQKCTKCQDDDRKPNQNQTKCICEDFKYENETTGKCQFCDQNRLCLQCQPKDPNQCLKCDKSKFRKQKPQNGTCVCMDGYFDKDGDCQKCQNAIADCDFCSSGENCLNCKNQSNFNPTPSGGKCICNQKWILDDKICKLCQDQIIGCSICSSIVFCTKCDNVTHFITEPTQDGKCKCIETYWLNKDTCKLCSETIPGCSTCSSDGIECLTCIDEKRKPNQDRSACICKDFYYQNTQTKECQACDQKHSCLKCNATSANHECLQCDSASHWQQKPDNGTCKCQVPYNEYNGNCILCKVDGCVSCQSQTTCKQCDPTKQFKPQPDGNFCNCIPYTYRADDNKSCLNCSSAILGCKQCSNKNQCQLCDTQNHFTINTQSFKCDCMTQFYLNKTKQCESCSVPIQNCLQCMSSNNIVLCQKCIKGYGTSNNNLTCIDCNTLTIGCLDCIDSKNCITCDQGNNFTKNGTLCKCKDGLYINNKNCLECSKAIPGCQVCNDQNTCTSCTKNNHFNPEPDQNKKCSCVQGFTLDKQICVTCTSIKGCLTCSDLNTCTKCDQTNNYELTKDNKCQCKQTYWQDANKCQLCKQSIGNCLKCTQDGKQCNQCIDANRTVNQNKTKCVCTKYMYEDNQNVCQYCDQYQNCVSCEQGGDHICQTCDTQKFYQQKPVNGTCICTKNYQQYNHKCILCQIVGCKECQDNNNCSQCSSENNFNPSPINNQCKCIDNTIFDTDRCYFCNQKIPGCTKCSNLSECQTCSQTDHFVFNQTTKLCSCMPTHYLLNSQCVLCSQGSQGIKYCQTCTINQDEKQCTSCKKGFQPSDDHSTCLNCQDQIIGCVDCQNKDECKQCDTNQHFELNGTNCVCSKGFFPQQRSCTNCSKPVPGCTNCNMDGSQCLQCDQGSHFRFNQGQKKCDCIDGYFLKVNECVVCSTDLPGCTTCQKDGKKCLSCSNGYFLEQNKCKLCSSTIPGCTKCNQNGDQCSQCNTQKFKFNQTTLKCDCIQSYFLNKTLCSLCQNALLSCSVCTSDGNQCLQCKNDHFVLNNQTKKCQCEQKFFLKNKKCQLCSSQLNGCEKCNQLGRQCTECKTNQNFILDNKTNTCLCNEGYFIKQTKCALCSTKNPGCLKCSQSGKQCSTCNQTSGFSLNNSTNTCQCKDTYFISSDTQCSLCSQKISYCTSCKSQGTQFTAICQTCKQGFSLNQLNTSCFCPGSDKQIIDGQCQDKKSGGWIIYGAIGGGALLLIGIGAFVYFKFIKAKSRLDLYEQMEDDDNGRTKPQTILTDNNTRSKVSKSGSLDIDE